MRSRTIALFLVVLLVASAASAQNLEFDRSRAKKMLEMTAKHIEKNFYDPSFRGVDWKASVREAQQRIDGAKSAGEMFSAIVAMVNRLDDSHTHFLPPQRANKAYFGFEVKAFGSQVRIHELKKGGAGDRAGLQLGDHVVGINGVAAERENIDAIMLILRALRPVGTMELDIVRKGQPMHLRVDADVKKRPSELNLTDFTNVFQLIREAEAEEVYYRYATSDDGIGYLQLPHFLHDDLPSFVRKLKNPKAIIIDLRGNPGGVIQYTEMFIGAFENEPVQVAELARRDKKEPIKARPNKPNFTGPLFILVDSESASAAEVVAHHFQRNKRAVVIGDRTSGRVTAARMYPESLGTDSIVPFGVQVAVGRLIFPGGEELEKKGVTPDELCIPDEDALRTGSDLCYAVAVSKARKALGLGEPAAAEKKSE